MARIILAIAISYLIGSVPCAYIFGRLLKGIDIRKFGSGNVGATNVLRVLGRSPAVAVLALDIFKGFIPVVFIADFFAAQSLPIPQELLRVILGFSCIFGHNWTIFLNFKGGKGVASTLGVLLGLGARIAGLQIVFGLVILTWLLFFLPFRLVSLASLVSGLSIPIYMAIFRQSPVMIAAGLFIAAFIILRHKANIARLILGKEPRVSFRKPS